MLENPQEYLALTKLIKRYSVFTVYLHNVAYFCKSKKEATIYSNLLQIMTPFPLLFTSYIFSTIMLLS